MNLLTRTNLLADSLFRVVTSSGQTTMSLPALLAELGRDKVESLTGLKRHQEDAFLVFLSQLGAGVLARTGESKPAQSEKFWRDSIREVTGRKDDLAWTLVVEDITKPAFMQAPLPFDEALSKKATSPDELDTLVTSKNHDLKMTRMLHGNVDDWIYAIVSFQTMSGYLGRVPALNRCFYGIARMNSGDGNRPIVEFRSTNRLGKLWYRNIEALLNIRKEILEGAWKYKDKGVLFTWLEKWDLLSSIPVKELDPFFIEVSRAIRLTVASSDFIAMGTPSKCRRIAAEEMKGVLGDPWTPLNKKKNTSLTVSASGFTPELVCELLFGKDYERSKMMISKSAGDGPVCLYASVLVRGKGKTNGLHTIKIMIPERAKGFVFKKKEDGGQMAIISKAGLDNAATMQNKVLKASLLSFLEGGPEKINFDRNEAVAWFGKMAERFRLEWESRFYDWLWNSAGEEENAAIKRWAETLKEIAEGVFEDSIKRLPSRTGRQMRSVVRAESVFKGSLYNNFPMLRKETTDAGNS